MHDTEVYESRQLFKIIAENKIDELYKFLLRTRQILNVCEVIDPNGYNPLHYAAYKNNGAAVKTLIKFLKSNFGDADAKRQGSSG